MLEITDGRFDGKPRARLDSRGSVLLSGVGERVLEPTANRAANRSGMKSELKFWFETFAFQTSNPDRMHVNGSRTEPRMQLKSYFRPA